MTARDELEALWMPSGTREGELQRRDAAFAWLEQYGPQVLALIDAAHHYVRGEFAPSDPMDVPERADAMRAAVLPFLEPKP